MDEGLKFDDRGLLPAVVQDWLTGEVRMVAYVNHDAIQRTLETCPVGISMRYISHLRMEELKALAKNRNVPAQIRSFAQQWVTRKEGKE